MADLSRRDLVRQAAFVGAALPLTGWIAAPGAAAQPATQPTTGPTPKPGTAAVRWLDGRPPKASVGATWGVPWPRGLHQPGQPFAMRTPDGKPVAVQSWPLAFWPDGSLKWTGHAVGPDAPPAEAYELAAGEQSAKAKSLVVSETPDAITVDAGPVRWRLGKSGANLIVAAERDGKPTLVDGHLVLLRQGTFDGGEVEPFAGEIGKATVEQSGPVKAVVRFEGKHKNRDGRAWLPWTVRLSFYAGGEHVGVVHTIVYDGDESKDFIRGLGLRFGVPLAGELHDRHVRFAGADGGVWADAVRGLTGLRRDVGEAIRKRHVAGEPAGPVSAFAESVRSKLHLIPAFGDFSLAQLSADGFGIRKRTRDGFVWLNANAGNRSAGLGSLTGPAGGAAFGVRNFWQSFPASLDVRGATGDRAEVTCWLWSPDAGPMDLRYYHDGLGQDTYEEQLQGLDITYEDYEPGFGTPMGVARTSELTIWALGATPTNARFAAMADALATPPTLVCTSATYHAAEAFGPIWSPADRSTPARADLEGKNDFLLDYYLRAVDQHRWYGFWNFGDVMHSYDGDRHVWRYDRGGFAWANSELSPDIWLWLSFVRGGRADVYRMAEAMTRHTGEVDVHHLGRFAGLGSRHNVLHWGDSAKQMRISTAANRRYYYYLSGGDGRVGELLREQLETPKRLVDISPGRKLGERPTTRPGGAPASINYGNDWAAMAAAWLTEWERTGDAAWRDKLTAAMQAIGDAPLGFFGGGGGFDPATGKITPRDKVDGPGASHLSYVFGGFETNAELIAVLDVPAYTKAWLQYCRLYNGSADEQRAELGSPLRRLNLQQGHSRLTAYAARRNGDAKLAARAWAEFFRGEGGMRQRERYASTKVSPPEVLEPIDEATWVGTNGTSQWGLAMIQNLAQVGEALPTTPSE